MTCLIANANMLSLPTPTFSFSLLPFTLKYTKVPRVILLSCHTRVCACLGTHVVPQIGKLKEKFFFHFQLS